MQKFLLLCPTVFILRILISSHTKLHSGRKPAFIFHIPIWSELRENEMSVVDLERKSIAAMKTGAPHLLLSVGRFIPTGQGHNSSLVRSPVK